MIRKLFIIAGASFVLALGCLSAAVVLVGRDGVAQGWDWRNFEKYTIRGHHDPDAQVLTRTLEWGGGEQLIVGLPVKVVYTQGTVPSVTVYGRQSFTDKVRLDNGHIRLEGQQADLHDARVEIVAPDVRRFDSNGAGKLEIHAYNHPDIDVRISGAGKVEANGTVQSLKLDISGAGDADLGQLKAVDANLSISGAGKADVFATGKVQAGISGAGFVNLETPPASLQSNISGAGRINQD
ncbi:GIN domain-containing protein [Asticcacaulis tiandongensis]|uniref:GIN domain-containing protein n=1 Tax=Asticcacaulis tiandongensis TaxID=2565365 RepID=UPI0015E83F44|nr:DUF2807 domain-containing protein [Asticcacaulis tiandongensis]